MNSKKRSRKIKQWGGGKGEKSEKEKDKTHKTRQNIT